jgi:hypothetical protein
MLKKTSVSHKAVDVSASFFFLFGTVFLDVVLYILDHGVQQHDGHWDRERMVWFSPSIVASVLVLRDNIQGFKAFNIP